MKGYQLLSFSTKAGVDSFAKDFGSEFIFFQGHPEYESLSLEREYLRDISRFLSGERDSYPGIPVGYFDAETEQKLVAFAARALSERRPALSAELPDRTLRQGGTAGTAATMMFRNWIDFLSERTRTAAAEINL
jgi:homoserine O-succinyltransferase/O-acetyltransferase